MTISGIGIEYNNCMIELNEDNIIFLGYHLSGIDVLGKEFCAIVEEEDCILIYALDDNDVGTLVEQIEKKQVKQINIAKEFTDKKSILGRGIVGGLLAGPWGAFIGALSANLATKCEVLSIIETTYGEIIFESVCC